MLPALNKRCLAVPATLNKRYGGGHNGWTGALETLTGARPFSGHTLSSTGAMYRASCGVDMWRIQLHGRWGFRTGLDLVRKEQCTSVCAKVTPVLLLSERE